MVYGFTWDKWWVYTALHMMYIASTETNVLLFGSHLNYRRLETMLKELNKVFA